MQNAMNESMKTLLNTKIQLIENHTNSDCIAYVGSIDPIFKVSFRDIIEDLKEGSNHETLTMILTTPGGDIGMTEDMVNIMRKHYNTVNFIVPNRAMSAGTILCMSGDNIYMDYSSSLGPIDAQIPNGKGIYVPVNSYLEKYNEYVSKSQNNTLTAMEFELLRSTFDIGTLKNYERVNIISISLLKDRLVKYKFKDWTIHGGTTGEYIKGSVVTKEEKEKRAEEIATKLSDSNRWLSHGRSINIETLETDLYLKIDDYSDNKELKTLIRDYDDLLINFITTVIGNNHTLIHTKKFF